MLDDEAQQLLPLLEVQLVDRGSDLLGKAGNSLTHSVLLTQFLSIFNQRSTLSLERPSPTVQFLSTMQEFALFYEAGLIQIRDASAFGANSVNLALEPYKLGGKQLIPRGLAVHCYRIFACKQHLWAKHGGTYLLEDERIELIGADIALRATPVLASRSQRIVICTIVVTVNGSRSATHFVTRDCDMAMAALEQTA